MTRGNQREKDRERAAARKKKYSKEGTGCGDVLARNAGDKARLLAKIEKKKALAAAKEKEEELVARKAKLRLMASGGGKKTGTLRRRGKRRRHSYSCL